MPVAWINAPRDPARYRVWPDQLLVSDRIAEVRAHADGLVEVHRPGGWRNAGDAVLKLTPQRLAVLRQTLRAAAPALRAPVALAAAVQVDDQAHRQRTGTVHEDSERVITTIDYRDADGRDHAFMAGALPRAIRIRRRRFHRRRFPPVPG